MIAAWFELDSIDIPLPEYTPVTKSFAISLAFLLVLAGGIALAEDKAKPTPEELNKADLEKLTGAWVVAKAEAGGMELPKELLAAIVLTIDGEKYKVEGIPEGTDTGTVAIDATKDVKEMTIVSKRDPKEEKVIKTIYKFDDDQLTVCYNLAGDSFPKEFKTTANSPQLLITYERKKDEEKKDQAK